MSPFSGITHWAEQQYLVSRRPVSGYLERFEVSSYDALHVVQDSGTVPPSHH